MEHLNIISTTNFCDEFIVDFNDNYIVRFKWYKHLGGHWCVTIKCKDDTKNICDMNFITNIGLANINNEKIFETTHYGDINVGPNGEPGLKLIDSKCPSRKKKIWSVNTIINELKTIFDKVK